MAVDQVHDSQQVYRALLHSMSRPGTISSVESVAVDSDFQLPCYDTTMLTVLTLLDAEVTFHIISTKNKGLIEKISEYTLAKFAPVNKADYVIVLRDATEAEIIHAMAQCKNGNLRNPHTSATWIMESSPLSSKAELRLSGPGIKNTATLKVSFTPEMWKARNERTKEYPLGIDLIFTDLRNQVACVPRTALVEIEEVY
ncbi:phosphonate C-P lyase system protein PhnH [Virgibacillus sediminis]|uniref:Phosphonate C-P lyase system protein PhnH n=1 Tax=Virgibacillus sediminis TaxID=202260 RepID=A0ABV7A1D5_9BACI